MKVWIGSIKFVQLPIPIKGIYDGSIIERI